MEYALKLMDTESKDRWRKIDRMALIPQLTKAGL